VDETEFRDLQERVAMIKEMSSHIGWQMLVDRANATMYQKQKWIILGKAKDWDEYKHAVAWMDGVSFVLGLPAAVEKEMIFELDQRFEADEAVQR
jgi:hypothetical protein